MKNPLVSVIIPNYNHARFLDERIQTVLNQTYQNFELIILDDKSTDNSVEVINQYKENPHVSHVVVNEENSGSSFRQWHKGFELAKGDVVWIAESVDSCDKTFLETLVSEYQQRGAAVVLCKSCLYGFSNTKYAWNLQDELMSDMHMDGKEFISRFMIGKNLVPSISAVLFNRQAALSFDPKYSELKEMGEWLFLLEMMEKSKVSFLNIELSFFRFRDPSYSKMLMNKGILPLESKVIFDFLSDHGYLKGLRRFREKVRWMSRFYYLDFESNEIRQRVLDCWDRHRVARLGFLGAYIKSLFFHSPTTKGIQEEPKIEEMKGAAYRPHKRILAVVVTYCPEPDLLKKCIGSFIDDVDKVLIWENTPEAQKANYRFIEDERVEYCGDGVNSISRALNYAWRYAADYGYDYLLTMDQDSQWEDFNKFLGELFYCKRAPEGIWGPNAYENYDAGIFMSDAIITSGMLVSISIINKVGGWDETFAIDCVDDEFCLRAGRLGVKVYWWGACRLRQRYGNPAKAKLFGRQFDIDLKNYSAQRLYSIYRNHVLLIRKFPEIKSIKSDFKNVWIPNIKWVVLFENSRIKKFKAIFRGIIDGYKYNF